MTVYTTTSLKAELNGRGWRLTPQRETILHIFQELPQGEHLSAEDLYHRLETDGEGDQSVNYLSDFEVDGEDGNFTGIRTG